MRSIPSSKIKTSPGRRSGCDFFPKPSCALWKGKGRVEYELGREVSDTGRKERIREEASKDYWQTRLKCGGKQL